MDITLIRCRATHGPRETNITGCYPPLGLAYLAASLRAARFDVRILDAEAEGIRADALPHMIPAGSALIGFTATTLLWPSVREAAYAVRRRFPDALLVIGGPHVTAFPAAVLRAGPFDVGVLGEGERTLVELARRHAEGRELAGTPGCATREGPPAPDARVRVNTDIAWVRDLDRLPFPALDLLPMHRYRSAMVAMPFVSMVTSRGCPYRCAFCSQIYSGRTLRSRSAANIVDEMEAAVADYGAREIVLFDETFGVRRDVALDVCAQIVDRRLRFRWNARTRIDVLDEELLRAMREAGCYLLHLGVESGTQPVLDAMNKHITPEQVERVVRQAHAMGYWLHGYFMLGYPDETRAQIAETIRFSRRLPLDWASYTITVPNPRTPLFDRAVADRRLAPDFFERYTFGAMESADALPWFTSEECSAAFLRRAKQRAYAGFYLRPRVLRRNLSFFLASGGLPRVAYAAQLWLREQLG